MVNQVIPSETFKILKTEITKISERTFTFLCLNFLPNYPYPTGSYANFNINCHISVVSHQTRRPGHLTRNY